MLWTYLQERLNEIDGNPATVCFCLSGREDKEERKKLHSLKGDDGVYTAKELPKQKKKPQHKLENIVQDGITNYGDTWKDCL